MIYTYYINLAAVIIGHQKFLLTRRALSALAFSYRGTLEKIINVSIFRR